MPSVYAENEKAKKNIERKENTRQNMPYQKTAWLRHWYRGVQ